MRFSGLDFILCKRTLRKVYLGIRFSKMLGIQILNMWMNSPWKSCQRSWSQSLKSLRVKKLMSSWSYQTSTISICRAHKKVLKNFLKIQQLKNVLNWRKKCSIMKKKRFKLDLTNKRSIVRNKWWSSSWIKSTSSSHNIKRSMFSQSTVSFSIFIKTAPRISNPKKNSWQLSWLSLKLHQGSSKSINIRSAIVLKFSAEENSRRLDSRFLTWTSKLMN